MTDFDLDHLGDVWRQPPDRAELESLMRSAEAVRRRARWGQLVDVASALAVGGVVLFLVLLNPEQDTLVVGAGAIIILLYGHYRQRRLRQEELRSLTGTAEEMLNQMVARVETMIRHTRFSLAAILPGLMVGLSFSIVVANKPADEFLAQMFRIGSEPWTATAVKLAVVAAVAATTTYLWRARRREKAELGRLTALRDAYRKETELSAGE